MVTNILKLKQLRNQWFHNGIYFANDEFKVMIPHPFLWKNCSVNNNQPEFVYCNDAGYGMVIHDFGGKDDVKNLNLKECIDELWSIQKKAAEVGDYRAFASIYQYLWKATNDLDVNIQKCAGCRNPKLFIVEDKRSEEDRKMRKHL